MTYKFTKSSENVLSIANNLAQDMGHNYIGTEHILYGLVVENSGVASKVLENQGVSSELILERIEALIGSSEEPISQIIGFTPRSKRIIENAFVESKKLGSDFIGTEHILIGIMKEGDSIAVRILLDLGVRVEDIYNEIVRVLNDYEKLANSNYKLQNGSYNSTVTLNQFGIDLSKQALEGKLDPRSMKEKPKVTNPNTLVGYVKSLYFAYLFITLRGLMNKLNWYGAPPINSARMQNLVMATSSKLIQVDRLVKLHKATKKGSIHIGDPEDLQQLGTKVNQVKTTNTSKKIQNKIYRERMKRTPYVQRIGSVKRVKGK